MHYLEDRFRKGRERGCSRHAWHAVRADRPHIRDGRSLRSGSASQTRRASRPMSAELTPLLTASMGFAYVTGIAFFVFGVYLSIRRRRTHPLLLLCVSAISFSWIEAPYDWAMYAQFPPALPRMPSWWPLNMTWGGLPSSVPIGYMSYFVLPAIVGAGLGRWLSAKFQWRRPTTLLGVGLVVGFCWALLFNGFLGAKLGV